MGLGFFALITNIFWYFRLKSSGTTRWDISAQTTVRAEGVSVSKLSIALLVIVALVWSHFTNLRSILKQSKTTQTYQNCVLECELLAKEGSLQEGVSLEQCISRLCSQ